jgi:hypothetical protein
VNCGTTGTDWMVDLNMVQTLSRESGLVRGGGNTVAYLLAQHNRPLAVAFLLAPHMQAI